MGFIVIFFVKIKQIDSIFLEWFLRCGKSGAFFLREIKVLSSSRAVFQKKTKAKFWPLEKRFLKIHKADSAASLCFRSFLLLKKAKIPRFSGSERE